MLWDISEVRSKTVLEYQKQMPLLILNLCDTQVIPEDSFDFDYVTQAKQPIPSQATSNQLWHYQLLHNMIEL